MAGYWRRRGDPLKVDRTQINHRDNNCGSNFMLKILLNMHMYIQNVQKKLSRITNRYILRKISISTKEAPSIYKIDTYIILNEKCVQMATLQCLAALLSSLISPFNIRNLFYFI